MQTASKLMMVSINVGDMGKSKSFYVSKLGFKVSTEYRQDDDNWWTSLEFPEGGAALTLSRASVAPDSLKPNMLSIYFEAGDLEATHKELLSKELELDDIQDDLFGPNSGVKWFNVKDPDGNTVFFVEKHDARAPF
jgi:catechol 2,3-dioxygenase-like lactoylglutathione lyase family enzyme